MSIWYAAVHPTAITLAFAIQDLCLHPEYVPALREEISTQHSRFAQTAQGLPLLDSFIKESARLTPIESCMLPYLTFPVKDIKATYSTLPHLTLLHYLQVL